MNKITRNLASIAVFSIVALIFLSPAGVALAQEYRPLTTLPGLFEAGKATNPVEIIKGIYGLAIGIGSVIATIMLIWAGFEYMYVESIYGKSHAKERITNAFIGLLVILGSYVLLRTINPSLVEFNIILPGGSGNLQGLVAEKVFSDYTERLKQLKETQSAVTSLKKEVVLIDSQMEAKENERSQYECEEDGSVQAECDRLEDEISALRNKRASAYKAYATAQIIQERDLGDLYVHEALENKVNEEIKNLRRDDSSGGETSAEYDFFDFLTETNKIFRGQIPSIDKQIAKLEKITTTDPDTKLLKEKALKELRDEKTYLEVSNQYFNQYTQDNYNNNFTSLRGLSQTISKNTQKHRDRMEAAGLSSEFIQERAERDENLLMRAYANYEEVQEACDGNSETVPAKFAALCNFE